ncbi:unnamed protein product [Dicrocoelium dendriticum]|nr:unnamed protein product [Dicrocoelium dendriticum]
MERDSTSVLCVGANSREDVDTNRIDREVLSSTRKSQILLVEESFESWTTARRGLSRVVSTTDEAMDAHMMMNRPGIQVAEKIHSSQNSSGSDGGHTHSHDDCEVLQPSASFMHNRLRMPSMTNWVDGGQPPTIDKTSPVNLFPVGAAVHRLLISSCGEVEPWYHYRGLLGG